MDTKIKKRRRVAVLICLLAVAVLAGLAALITLLITKKDKPDPAQSASGQPVVSAENTILAVELESDWANFFLQRSSREEQEQYLADTLDRAQSAGANTVLLTGRVGEDAIFRGKQKVEGMPAPAPKIKENDRFLSKFDPMEVLLEQAEQRGMQLALIATDDWGTQIFDGASVPKWLDRVASKYKMAIYSPMSKGTQMGARLYTSYDARHPELLRLDGQPGNLAAAYQLGEASGLILGNLSALEADPSSSAMLMSWIGDSQLPKLLDKEVPQELAIVSPSPDQRVWGDQIYLLGTSDPAGGPVTVNGAPVSYQGSKGVWGVLLPLQGGANNFSAVQGGNTQTVTVNKPTGGGGGGGAARPDPSKPAEWGQKLRITQPLASLLSKAGDPDSITMTAYEGAVAEVAKSLPLGKNGQGPYAYQLHNGSFVRSKDCELLPPGTPDAAFTGAAHQTADGLEVIDLQGTGTPIYTHVWDGNSLSLTFLSSQFTGSLPAEFGFGGATVTSELGEGSFALNFTFQDSDPLWGYHVDYTPEGGTRIVLKHRPKKSGDPQKPLTGVTVMLDPGHGGTDMGAVGSTSESFPQEKDMNLAEARAAQHRLEQLGATVLMTREEDVTLSLGDRVKLLNEKKPDFFVSLHHNSSELNKDLSDVSFTEAYWFYTEGKPLADNLVNRVTAAAGRPNHGSFYNYFYVTRSNICPAVLLESGFVCSPKDYELGTDTGILWAEGAAVAQAIVDSIPG